jgi:hypothetical protein
MKIVAPAKRILTAPLVMDEPGTDLFRDNLQQIREATTETMMPKHPVFQYILWWSQWRDRPQIYARRGVMRKLRRY